jgi:diguanylate cyclase (GGDEF)-like protein/PAS domain S-box-containing protein
VDPQPHRLALADTRLDEIVRVGGVATQPPMTLADALVRLAEAEDTLRAIGAGEVDAFVISDSEAGGRVFSLSTADRPYRMFVESMRDGAATVSSSGIILYANRRLAELLAHPIETIVGAPLAPFVVGGPPIGFQEIHRLEALGATIELELIDRDGNTVPVRVAASPLDVDGDHLLCLTFTDLRVQKAQDREIARLSRDQGQRMADLQRAQAALTQQATHDALTGLPNRALLVERIDQVLSHSTRSGRCTAVLFVDLDRFKQVNDSQGHAAGDVVLRRVAQQLVAALRPMDTVARIGGDEFVVLAPDVKDQLHAVDIGSRLVASLSRQPDRLEEGERITASIGISISVGGRGTAETLIVEADIAMYKAKSRGGGRFEVFDAALGQQVHERSAAQRMLQSALDDHRVTAHYQPVIDLSTGRVAGFEALARITEHDGSILAPAAFIPAAEDSGLIVPLGAQILEIACHQAHRWQWKENRKTPLTLAVNVSARQFAPGDLPTVIRATLERTGLDPMSLHLELTETVIIDLHPEVLEQLEQIRELGVQIGLDDYGTGYASLTHLRSLPLTFVKIDRSFVSGLGTELEDERIVSAVVDLAANLGLRSIAEGVETTAQLDRLRDLGCDQAQGYLFARPLPPDKVATALQRATW